jgi:hypothetical protein
VALAVAAPGPYAIVQFDSPIKLADRARLEQTSVQIIGYLPDYAYLLSGTPAQLDAAARLPGVYARVPFTLADKLSPALLRAVVRGERAMGPVRIRAWPGEEQALARALAASGVADGQSLSRERLFQVAKLPAVRWIEPANRPRFMNDVTRAIMNVGPVWEGPGLFGTGQIVAVADSGLDTGDMGTLSPDFAGRIAATHVLSDGGHWDDNQGHGTHVAGSIAGAGVQSGADPGSHTYAGSFAGVAPEANLVVQAFEATPTGEVLGLDPDYYQLFQQAYDDGARVHSDSWGDYTGLITDTEAAFGGYPYGSQRTDSFVWDHPDMAIFVAAGNAGTDGAPGPLGLCEVDDGVVDPDSLLAPGTAKNVITVGAGEGGRTSGGLSGLPWLIFGLLGQGSCFSTEPINLDEISGEPQGMAAFSSRGPTDDGRAKPDLVAPGTSIVSNRSHHPDATTLWGVYETNADYLYSGGTSMATPLTAGAGVLVRQWLVSQGVAVPSAALVKAMLLNTTTDMAPGQYGTGATQEIPFERPNSVAGWGRADLGFIAAPAPYAVWTDDHRSGLITGQVVTYTHTPGRPLEVLTTTQPLRVMLVWTDYPAELSASVQLVNDLDLSVIGPGGAIYHGNGATGGDHLNNVEGVVIENPPIGQYRVRVSGYQVPMEIQPYALVVAGPLGVVQQPSLTVAKTPSSTWAQVGQMITYTYRITNTGNVTLTGLIGHDDKLGALTFGSGVLEPDQQATSVLTYSVRVSDGPGPIVNSVTVTGTDALDPDQHVTATDMAEVEWVPRLAIAVAKTASVPVAQIGQVITYTYRVTNAGTVTLTGLTGTDDKLGPLTFTSGILEPNQQTTSTLTYTVRASDSPGPIINSVTVTGTDALNPGQHVTATDIAEVEWVPHLSIAVAKTASVPAAQIGQVITYTYRVTNAGTVTLTGLTGTDDKLGPLTFTSGILEPNQQATSTLTYTVRVSDSPGPIVNSVTVTGTDALNPAQQVTATATAEVEWVPHLSIAVAKTASVPVAQIGQVVTYTYWVTNTGDFTLTQVAGKDDRLGPVTFAPLPLAPTDHATGTLTYRAQMSDLPGPIVNRVNVTGTTILGMGLQALGQDTATIDLQIGYFLYLPVLTRLAP